MNSEQHYRILIHCEVRHKRKGWSEGQEADLLEMWWPEIDRSSVPSPTSRA